MAEVAVASSPPSSSPPAPLVPVSAIGADLALLSSRFSQFDAPIAAAAVDSYAVDFFAQPLDDNFLAEAHFQSPVAVASAPAPAPVPAPVPVPVLVGACSPLLREADVTPAVVAPLQVAVESVEPAEPIEPVDADIDIAPLPSPRPVVPPRPRNKSALTPRATVIF